MRIRGALMRNILALLILLLSTSAHSAWLKYDTVTGNIIFFSNENKTVLNTDEIVVDGTSKLLNANFNFLQVNLNNKKLVRKSQADIDQIILDQATSDNIGQLTNVAEKLNILDSIIASTTNQVVIQKLTANRNSLNTVKSQLLNAIK
jgi:Cft2 family RNA processing exonuclease